MDDKPAFYGYPYDPQDGRENAAAGPEVYRVTRGGSFEADKDGVRCAARSPTEPGAHDASHGFRVMVLVPL